MKTAQEIRAMMRGGNATIGTWLQFPSADVAEVMGASGYDWVAVDMEHGAFTRAILPDVFRAIERGGSTPFARIAQAELRPIKDALDSGAQGLVFPMIESREQLDRAISLSLYPDAGGSRGVGYSRANMYGRDFDPYRVDVAKDILLVAQIEHIRAVDQLDAILSHPRLDAIMVGPYDLSGSMGLTGQFDHPDFVAVMARINEATCPWATTSCSPSPNASPSASPTATGSSPTASTRCSSSTAAPARNAKKLGRGRDPFEKGFPSLPQTPPLPS